NEDGRVVRRIVTPPAGPRRIGSPRPRSAPEHVAAHDIGADVGLDFLDHSGAGVMLAARLALRLAPRIELEEPFVQAHPADADRVLLALVGAGDVAVQRDRDVEPDDTHPQMLAAGPAGIFGSIPAF